MTIETLNAALHFSLSNFLAPTPHCKDKKNEGKPLYKSGTIINGPNGLITREGGKQDPSKEANALTLDLLNGGCLTKNLDGLVKVTLMWTPPVWETADQAYAHWRKSVYTRIGKTPPKEDPSSEPTKKAE